MGWVGGSVVGVKRSGARGLGLEEPFQARPRGGGVESARAPLARVAQEGGEQQRPCRGARRRERVGSEPVGYATSAAAPSVLERPRRGVLAAPVEVANVITISPCSR